MSLLSGSMGAVMGSGATEDAANKQFLSAQQGMDLQRQMYNQSKKDFAPFLDPSAQAMATLQSGIYGTPATYKDRLGNAVEANFAPPESGAFKYTKNRTLEDLGRQLRMMGRGSGTVAANATGRTLGDLNAANEEKYNNNLLNLVKIGQGAAGSTTASGQNYGNSVANLMQSQGNAMAQGGMARANLYAGLGAQSANAISNAYQGYKIGQGLGWWGAPAAATVPAATAPTAGEAATLLA